MSEKHGDDANDGLSPETAWKTTKNVNDGPVTIMMDSDVLKPAAKM